MSDDLTVTLELEAPNEEVAEKLRGLGPGAIGSFEPEVSEPGPRFLTGLDTDTYLYADMRVQWNLDDDATTLGEPPDDDADYIFEDATLSVADEELEGIVDAEVEAEDDAGREFSGSFAFDLDDTEITKEKMREIIEEEVEVSIAGPPDHPPSGPTTYGDTHIPGETFEAEMKAAKDPGGASVSMDPKTDPMDMMTFETHTFEVSAEIAEETFESVADAIESRRNDGYTIDEVILGVPQYKALYVYVQSSSTRYSDETPESLLGVEVTVVPGPMIHPVIDNRRLLTEML